MCVYFGFFYIIYIYKLIKKCNSIKKVYLLLLIEIMSCTSLFHEVHIIIPLDFLLLVSLN